MELRDVLKFGFVFAGCLQGEAVEVCLSAKEGLETASDFVAIARLVRLKIRHLQVLQEVSLRCQVLEVHLKISHNPVELGEELVELGRVTFFITGKIFIFSVVAAAHFGLPFLSDLDFALE